MKTNWKRVVEDQNAKAYPHPEGWSTREQVADELECSPERVSEVLRPGIKSGDIEVNDFVVWDKPTRKLVKLRMYRQVEQRADKPKDGTLKSKVAAYLSKHPGASVERVCNALRRRDYRPTAADVRAVMV